MTIHKQLPAAPDQNCRYYMLGYLSYVKASLSREQVDKLVRKNKPMVIEREGKTFLVGFEVKRTQEEQHLDAFYEKQVKKMLDK